MCSLEEKLADEPQQIWLFSTKTSLERHFGAERLSEMYYRPRSRPRPYPGRMMRNSVPSPSFDSTVRVPPWPLVTMS